MTTVNEKELLDRARNFDLQALAEVYDRYSPGIYRYAVRLLGEAQLAEDCVAETFSRFLQALKAGAGPRDYLQAYLYRSAHNWITDYYRRQPPPPLALEESLQAAETDPPEGQVGEILERERVRAALYRLTPDQRQVIVLKFLEGWTNEEIAHALNKPVGAVKSLQHRALASLQRMLRRDEEEVYEVSGID